MRDLIRSSTTSMTSVPMPLKFLRVHYGSLKEAYDRLKDSKPQQLCASIISVLAMGQESSAAPRECLKYCLLAKQKDVGDWGHEYVRQLEGEIAEEWAVVEKKETLLPLIESVVKFDMAHNAEIQVPRLFIMSVLSQVISIVVEDLMAVSLSHVSRYVNPDVLGISALLRNVVHDKCNLG